MGPLRVRVEKRSQGIAGADVEMCHSDPSPRKGLLPGPFAPSEFVSTAESRFGQWHIFFGWSPSRDSLKEWPDSLKEKKNLFLPSAERSAVSFMFQCSPGGSPGCIKGTGRQVSKNIFIFSAWSVIFEPRALAKLVEG